MYSGRTGKEVMSWEVYRTGNDSFVSSLRYFLQKIEASLPTYGMILNRKNQEVLIDIGKKDGLALENIGDSSKEWLIVKKGSKAEEWAKLYYYPYGAE